MSSGSAPSPDTLLTPGAGARSIVLAAFAFATMSLFAKVAGERLSSHAIVFVRSLMTLALTFVFLRRAGVSPWGSHRVLLFLRGAFGFIALSCFYYSVTQLPLAEATVIQFTNPVFTALLAALLLKEAAGGRVWVAIVLALSGVLLITRPAALFAGRAPALDPGVVAIALAGAFATAVAYVIVRRLAPLENELVIIFYFPLIGAPGAFLLMPGWIWPTAGEWLLLVGVAVSAQAGQIFLTRGIRALPAGRATVVLYLQIVFATLWGMVLLGETPDAWTVVGSLIVLGGTVIASRRARMPA